MPEKALRDSFGARRTHNEDTTLTHAELWPQELPKKPPARERAEFWPPEAVTPLMTCSASTACDTAYQQTDDPSGRVHGLAHASGADVRRGRARRGNALPRDGRVPLDEVRRRCGVHAALDGGSQHEERGCGAACVVGVLRASAGNGERCHPHRSAPAGGVSEHSVTRDATGRDAWNGRECTRRPRPARAGSLGG